MTYKFKIVLLLLVFTLFSVSLLPAENLKKDRTDRYEMAFHSDRIPW